MKPTSPYTSLYRVFFMCINLMLLSATTLVQAQTSQTYTYQNATFAWDAPSGTATKTVWDSANSYCSFYIYSPQAPTNTRPGDDVKADIAFPSGFTFTYAGTAYSSVRVLSNGMIQFGTDAGFHRDYTYQALPVAAAAGFPGGSAIAGCANSVPTNILFPYWLDMDAAPNTTAGVFYEIKGSAPNRRFVITWNNVFLYNNSTYYNLQVVFYEGVSTICTAAAPGNAACNNGEFEFRYTNGSTTGTGATVGVQVGTTDYTQYASNQAFIDPVNGTNIHWYPAPPAAQVSLAAEYRFDEAAWAGTQGEIVDSSGSGNSGVRVGATVNTSATQFKICRAMLVPSNTSNATIGAAALGNTVTSSGYTPGSTGSVSFWYRPSASGADAMLLDATRVAGSPFYIMRVGSNNFIKMAISDSAGTIVTATSNTTTAVANTWIHVAATWKLATGTNATIIQIFINGTLNTVARGTTNGSLPTLAIPAYAGDNRTSGVTPSGGTGNSANGYIDEMRFYTSEIGQPQARSDYQQTRASCSVLHHFDITINSTTGPSTTNVNALTCEQVGVSIVARDVSNNPVTIASNATLSTSTNHGDWTAVSGGGASSFTNNGNGSATFTFNNTSTATFQFNDRFQETTSIGVNSGGIVESATADPSLVLTHEGLRFVTDATGSTVATAANYQGTSCTDSTLYVQSMKTDLSTFSCVANTGTSGKMGSFRNGGTPIISLAMQCVDPTTCLTTGTAIANGVTLPRGASSAAAPGVTNYADVTLPAVTNNNGVAAFPLRYRDAGKVRLYASYNYQDSNGLTATVIGQSPQFAIGPKGFAFCNVLNGATANPGSTSLAGTLFAHAGDTFTSDIWALACGASNSVCGSYASAAACVATNDCAGNFGQESSGNKHGGGSFSLSGTLVAPSPASPTLGHSLAPNFVTSTPVFNSGLATGVQMYWNEVGTMVPALSLSNFFGSTLPYSGGGTNVGRFAPYKFSINPIPGCSTATAFTYSGQPFTGTITAQAKDGTTTQNYDNAPPFNRAFARIVTVTDTSAAAGSFTNNARANTDFAAGVATVTAVNPISWAFTSPPQSPVTLAMVARDTEQAVDVTSSFLIRNGRVRMENALGSELLTLPVRMVAEYYINGTSGWTQNADDSCASLPAPTFSNYTRTLSAGETTATQWSPLRSGNAGLRLSAPGNGNVGSVTLTTTVPSYLQFNWTGAGVTNPSARATFGAASGQNQQMFLRENY